MTLVEHSGVRQPTATGGSADGRASRPRPDSRLRIVIESALAVLLLVLMSPLLLVIALLIRLDSRGPALFHQERLGLHRQPLNVVKFRSMVVAASEEPHREYVTALLTHASPPRGESGLYKIEDDPRITRVGRMLRRFSLDELPQLFNIVRGDMAFVGPRPVLAYEAELFSDDVEPRFTVRPGLTGLWQVSGRNAVGFREALAYDVEYVQRRSVRLDLAIVARTVIAVFRPHAR